MNDVSVACLPSISQKPFTIGSILKAIEENPLSIGIVTKDLENVTYNTTVHKRRKLEMENLFFQALSTHPQAYPLTKKIVDPEQPDGKMKSIASMFSVPVGKLFKSNLLSIGLSLFMLFPIS